MSDDPTQDLAGKYDTKPTMETLLSEMRAGFARSDERFEGLESRFDKMEGQFNRAISVIHDTRAELIELRREFRERFKEPA